MLVAVTLIMAALVAAGLLAVARERQGLAPVTLYCPLHETVVSVKGDCCFAEGETRAIDSIRHCQRECLIEREAKA
jgi:hypothetical protein